MSDAKHPQWEYLVLQIEGSTLVNELRSIFDKHGEQGWEYVGQLPASWAGGVTLIFKRLK
jgi:hypothetical protein